MIDIESIYAALWSRVSAVHGFTLTQRRLKHWDDFDSAESPFLCMSTPRYKGEQKQRLPAKWELTADLYIYVWCADKTISPGTIINPLVKNIGDAIDPDPSTGIQDLGLPGLVSHCWIEGDVEIFEGLLGEKAVAIVPVKILATG